MRSPASIHFRPHRAVSAAAARVTAREAILVRAAQHLLGARAATPFSHGASGAAMALGRREAHMSLVDRVSTPDQVILP
jgi:hypothetical protein